MIDATELSRFRRSRSCSGRPRRAWNWPWRRRACRSSEVREPHPLAFRAAGSCSSTAGRSRPVRSGPTSRATTWRSTSTCFRQGERVDPFRALVDTEGAPASWSIEGLSVVERVARYPKARIRRTAGRPDPPGGHRAGRGLGEARGLPVPVPVGLQPPARPRRARARRLRPVRRGPPAARRLLDPLRQHGGLWRLSRACSTTSEASTPSRTGITTSSTETPAANRRNLERAHRFLVESGFEPEGFAGPHGRWNEGIDGVLEDLGYSYSSDFQLGYDDLPFFPWRGDRFSKVLQVPVHPLCEGVFFEAGGDARTVADHFVRVVRAKVEAGEPAFVYGHPERQAGPPSRDRPRTGRGRRPRVVALADDPHRVRPLVALARRPPVVGRGPGGGPLRGPVRRVGRRLSAGHGTGPGPTTSR